MAPARHVIAYLSLGSNLGDRKANLDKALQSLAQQVEIIKTSSVYETEPVSDIPQSDFLNMVVEIKTELSAAKLLRLTKAIETEMGRRPGPRNSPRTIDIDILLYGQETIETPELTAPHPRLTERAFVLVPLAEIAPEVVHPSSGKTIKKLLAELRDPHEVRKWSEKDVRNYR